MDESSTAPTDHLEISVYERDSFIPDPLSCFDETDCHRFECARWVTSLKMLDTAPNQLIFEVVWATKSGFDGPCVLCQGHCLDGVSHFFTLSVDVLIRNIRFSHSRPVELNAPVPSRVQISGDG
jgi:hypothetical protein